MASSFLYLAPSFMSYLLLVSSTATLQARRMAFSARDRKPGNYGDFCKPLVVHLPSIYVLFCRRNTDPDNTRIPLVAWDKGIQGPPLDSNASSHDDYSKSWRLDHLLHQNEYQADLSQPTRSLASTITTSNANNRESKKTSRYVNMVNVATGKGVRSNKPSPTYSSRK
ncbi:hypothetical protein J3A83DRAFT_1700201 [Scleroderma citrinum]